MSRESWKSVERVVDLTEKLTRAMDSLDSAGQSELESIAADVRGLVDRGAKLLNVEVDHNDSMLLGTLAGAVVAYYKPILPSDTPVDVGSYLRGK